MDFYHDRPYLEMTDQEYVHTTTIRLFATRALDLDRAASMLVESKTVALPTETVYGLAANGLDERAIEKIFAAKGRPLNNPLILHVHDMGAADALFDFRDDRRAEARFVRLAKAFWPGPLTLIAKKAPHVPFRATAGLDTVAVRVPKNQSTLSILKALGFPLVMPSANMSTRPSPTCAAHVLATLDGRIDAVLDDGTCDVGIESTVVRIDTDGVIIARPGMIDMAMVAHALGEEVITIFHDDTTTFIAPGQSTLHYSPNVKAVHVCTMHEATAHWSTTNGFLMRRADYKTLRERLGDRPAPAHNILLDDEPQHVARELYHHLYVAERAPDQTLVIVIPDDSGKGWHAIIDRLKRTAR